jgi:predicted MFS family arabinose efflux permease
VSSPIGGLVVEWTRRRDGVLVFGNLAFALFMLLAASSGQVLLMVILIGATSGLAVGSMMSLPATALAPDQRALGMGVFFTVFYFFSFTGPALGGWLAELTGDVGITFEFGAVSLVASTALLIVYHRLMRAHGLAISALKSSPC